MDLTNRTRLLRMNNYRRGNFSELIDEVLFPLNKQGRGTGHSRLDSERSYGGNRLDFLLAVVRLDDRSRLAVTGRLE